MDLIHEYRTQGLKTLDRARGGCERFVGDMARVFGEFYQISLQLYTTVGDLLDEFGELSGSEALRVRVRGQVGRTTGIDYPYYVRPVGSVARSHT